MQQPLQNYANHRASDRKMIAMGAMALTAALLAIIGVWTWWGAAFAPVLITVALLLQAVCYLALQIKLRLYALTVQDRVIRLEMQLRLERVLPAELRERGRNLSLPQLIALRFAADTELPELVDKVAADNIQSPDAIKRLIKHWQPDFLRV